LQFLNSLRCFIGEGEDLLSVIVKDLADLSWSQFLAEFVEKGKADMPFQ
jgi:hypothetical protein